MKNNEYNPNKIEKMAQKYWIKKNIFSVTEDQKKEKFYCLPMLPYPSGKLHMGHVRNYTICDVIARYQRMLGRNVLHPIGWDAFGLPAEETAIKNNVSPKRWTYSNISIMKKQLISLGFSYDWNREITTCKPEYYRWEQLFFIKLFKKKMVYRKKTLVNWCEFDQTVLANEQAQKGLCWRCGSKITLKKVSQWFIKITEYAEELLKDLQLLTEWPKEVISMQKNWIGKSNGIKINCTVYNTNYILKIYTTQPEAIMGVTFFAISIYHPLISYLLKDNDQINQFIQKNKKQKLVDVKYNNQTIGINTNLFVLHPITQKKIPLWITNYVKHDYSTGAIMAVPGSNTTDHTFAQKNNIPIKEIFVQTKNTNDQKEEIVLVNSQQWNGLNIKKARKIISNFLIKKNIAKYKVFYKIKDWCISRQRYWGTPIPVIKNNKGKFIPVSENKLPIILPEKINLHKSLKSLISKKNSLKKNRSNKLVSGETDTFDTFMESSWYYARYTNPYFNTDIIDIKSAKYWLPVDQYVGGIEHAVMHLIYFRFYHKLLRDFGYLHSPEPVKKLICQGMVIIDSFYINKDDGRKKWLPLTELNITRDIYGKIIKVSKKNDSQNVIYAGKIKMSKSKNNGIDPAEITKKYGADTLRLFLMFAAPISSDLEWNSQSIIGMHRFLKKIWNFVHSTNIDALEDVSSRDYKQKKILSRLHKTILIVTKDIATNNSYNTAIAQIIKFFNYILEKNIQKKINKNILKESLETIIKIMYPFTPHICFFLWKKIKGNYHSIDTESWPQAQKNLIISNSYILVIQINGKKRSTIKINNYLQKQEIITLILKKEEIKKYFSNTEIKKVIYIPKKIINFVLFSKK